MDYGDKSCLSAVSERNGGVGKYKGVNNTAREHVAQEIGKWDANWRGVLVFN